MDTPNIPFDKVIEAIQKAGAGILTDLNAETLAIETKADESSVTDADKNAHRSIVASLAELTPDIPVLSEEGTDEEQARALASPIRWITDPLDGTRTAIGYAEGKKNHDEFGVHLALVVGDAPIFGVAHFPAMQNGEGVTYYSSPDGKAAYKQTGNQPPKPIHVSRPPIKQEAGLRAAVHHVEGRRPTEIAGRPYTPIPGVGGQRLCLVAEGSADIADMNDISIDAQTTHAYKQWDVAAAHAILKAAGGELVAVANKKPVTYATDDMKVPPCYGGGVEMLKLLEIGDLPPKGREI